MDTTNIKTNNLVLMPQLQKTLAETQVNSVFVKYNLDVTPQSQWFIAHTDPRARKNLPYVQELGEFEALGDYMTTRQGLPSYLLKVCLDGEGQLDYDGKQYRIGAGQFFWIDCQKTHYYETAAETGKWNIVWVHFWGSSTTDYYQSFIELNNNSPVGVMKYYDAPELIRKLIQYYSSSMYKVYQNDIKASLILTTLMTYCLNSVMHKQQDILNRQMPQFVPEVQAYITEHFNERITLDSLAETFYMNKFYLQKKFRFYVGVSPNEFQKSIRIEKAKELLRASNMSIDDISVFLGFENTSYFIRCFKKHEGTTPLQFRKKWNY